MRRRLAVFRLALGLWLTGLGGLCLAQDSSPPPDIPGLTQRARAGDLGAMMALGDVYMEGNGVRRDLDAAIGWFANVAQTNDANALYQLSYALRERNNPGDLDLALRYGLAASERARKSMPPAYQAGIQVQLGYVYDALKRFDEAIAAYEAARRLVERRANHNPLQIVAIYLNLANALASAGRQEESAAATDKAISVLSALPESNSDLMADLHTNKAISLISLARYGEALGSLDEALAIYTKYGGPDSPNAANVLKTKSRAYTLLARYQEALESAQAALAIYGKAQTSDPKAIAQSRVMLGLAYQGQARYDKAREQYLAAAKILESNRGDDSIAMMHPLTNLGNVDDELGHYEDALENYQKALALMIEVLGFDHPDVATMLGRLGNTSRKLKRYDAALNYGLQALLVQTGAADADVDNQRYTFRMLAQTLRAKDKRATAVFFAKQAVNAHQEVRARNSSLSDELRVKLGQSFQPSYHLLSELLLEDGQFSEAQFVGGLLKQQEFYEFTQNGSGRYSEDPEIEPGNIRLTEAELKFWTDMRSAMAPALKIASDMRALMAARETTGTLLPEQQARLQDLKVKRDQAGEEFIASARGLIDRAESENLLARKTAFDSGQRYAEKIQADLHAMGSNTVLLQIMSLEDGLYLFVSAAGRDTVQRKVSVTRPELARKVSAAVNAVKNRADDAIPQLAELYDQLIRPVRADLDAAVARNGADTPVLLLDLSGFLRYIPFAALYDGRHYLVEDFAPALYNPANPTKFAPLRRGKIKGAGFGVTREHPGFAALPGVSRELMAVSGIVGGKPMFDDAFNEKSLAGALSAKTQILHIASHFRFRPGNETNSYLLLGNGDGLTLSQLRTQRQYRFRGTDLITLSACETALGGGAEGEEIESFGMLAQAKGASAVLSTLWQIADDSTAVLMTDFYDGLIKRGLDKAHALRNAQLRLIQGTAQPALQASRAMTVIDDADTGTVAVPTAHPYYWSAFILMGNWM